MAATQRAGVVRVGVTGHRSLRDPASAARAVDAALDGLVASRNGADGPPTIELRTSLAEGADRLVAGRVLARSGRLVCVLPFAPAHYRADFPDEASRRTFDELSAAAAVVHVVEAPASPHREAAYEAAGRAVVDGSEVLLALWDGRPSQGQGGTADIVAYARSRGVEVVVITSERRQHGDGPPR